MSSRGSSGRGPDALPDLDGLAEHVTTTEDGGEDRDSLPVEAPFTGEVVGEVPECEPADVEAAIARARTAQESWADRTASERAAVFLRFHDHLLERREALLDVLQVEGGQARRDAFGEVLDAAFAARHYAHRAGDYLASEKRRGPVPLVTTARVHHHPVGVVGIVSPWNYPFTLAISDAIPALLAGNAVVLKPAEETPFAALLGKRWLVEAGLPEACLQVVTGPGEPLGEPLVAGSDHVCFTGSTAVGRRIGALAGEHLVDCSLELGGHNPMLVLDDADLDRAVAGAVEGSFDNAGQLCLSFERVLVHESRYEAFLDRFVARTEALALGTGYDYDADVGSLISARQLEQVQSHVEDAVARGATVETGGEPRPDVGPYCFEPTILTGVPPDADAACEETFGPVVAVDAYADVDEAIERANDTDYGLHASVWTGDRGRGRRVARRVETGTVSVDDAYVTAWASMDAPMGGRKDSGVGRRHGEAGFYRFTEPQTVTTQRTGPLLSPPGGMDYGTFVDRAATLLRYLKNVPWLR